MLPNVLNPPFEGGWPNAGGVFYVATVIPAYANDTIGNLRKHLQTSHISQVSALQLSQLFRCNKHRRCRSRPAHRYVLALNHFVKSLRIESQYLLDRPPIFKARYTIRFVVIHIAGRNDQRSCRFTTDRIACANALPRSTSQDAATFAVPTVIGTKRTSGPARYCMNGN